MAYLKFLIPRILILAAVLAVAWLSLNMVVRRTFIASWQEQTGTQLEIGEVKMRLALAQLELTDLTVTTLGDKPTKLVTAERFSIQFDRNELLRRRFLADETRLSNIKLELSGLGENGLDLTEYWNDAQSQFDLIAGQVRKIPLDELMTNNLDEAAKQIAKDFAMYNYSEQLKQRWVGEVETFKKDANTIKGRLDTIKQNLDYAEKTPEGKVNAAIVVLGQIDALAAELKSLETIVPEIEKKLKTERNALTGAVQKDQVKLESLKRQRIEPVDFSEYVLGEEMRERLTGLIAWIDWGRTQVPEEDGHWFDRMQFLSSKRLPGTNVAIPGIESRPEVHFAGIGIDGQVMLWGQPMYFIGAIRDYSNQPRKMSKPIVMRFCISKELSDKQSVDDYLRMLAEHEPQNLFHFDPIRIGQPPQTTSASQTGLQNASAVLMQRQDATAIDIFRLPETLIVGDENRNLVLDLPTLYVTAMFDRTGDVPHDRFLISCLEYHLPQRVLGNPQQLAFAVSPGVSQFRAELDIKGDALTGNLTLLQSPITIQAKLPSNMQGTPIERALATTTRALDTIQAEIDISGTRTAPTYAFHSNLGDRLASQVEPLLQQEWGQINSKLTSLLNQQITASTGLLDAVAAQEIQPLLDNLKLEHGQVTAALQQGNLDVDQLIRSQLYRFSEKEQQQIQSILASQLGQSLLKRTAPNGTQNVGGTNRTSTGVIGQVLQQQLSDRLGNNVGTQIDEKANELINRHITPEAQNALRGIFDNLNSPSRSTE